MKAFFYDGMMKKIEDIKLKKERRGLLSGIEGEVIEFGAGTGVNFEFYLENTRVVAIEPDNELGNEARNKVKGKNIEVVSASAEDLPFPDDSFDSVVITLALCTIDHPDKALKEAKRVCRSDGTLLILEHIRNDNRLLSCLQDILTPLWKRFAMGCHLNRDTLALIKENNFEKVYLNYFFGNNFIVGRFKNIK